MPESEAPTIPNATMNQGAWLLALKKVLLSAFRPVINEMTSRKIKYAAIKKIIYVEVIKKDNRYDETNIEIPLR